MENISRYFQKGIPAVPQRTEAKKKGYDTNVQMEKAGRVTILPSE
jgi:hypothetical protein